MGKPLVNLRASPEEKARWLRAAGGEPLGSWIRRQCNVAAARSELGMGERPAPAVVEAPRRRVREHRGELQRRADSFVDAAVAEAEGRSERNAVVVVVEPPRRSEAERWAERLARVEAEGRGLAVQRPLAAVVEAVEPPVVEGPRYRPCRDHPFTLPSLRDPGRCSWGCRLPPG